MKFVTSRLGIIGRLVFIVCIGLAGVGFVQWTALGLFEQQALDAKADGVRGQTDIAVSLVAQYHELSESGSLTKSQAQARAVEAIERLRYDDGNYFWINTRDMKLRAHGGNRALRGNDMSDFKDPDGVYIFREIVESVAESPTGVVRYRWAGKNAAPGDPPIAKLSVVQVFEPWDWIVGTGTYIDDLAIAQADMKMRMAQTMAVILLVMLVTASIVSYAIIHPISVLTKRMTTLAQGDTEAAVPYGEDKTTFGKIAFALEGFRQSLLESARLREQEAEREQQERERQAREAEAEHGRALAETAAQQAAADEKRALEDSARAEREAVETAARQEREARANEQQKIVATLAEALNAFAEGDLTARISQPFPDAYESLRENFNRSVAGLESVMENVASAGEQVGASSKEISTAATDMAKQTEQVSAAIEGTSASVTELTSSAKMASEAASDANALMELTQKNANKSWTVTKSAVGTMGKINESSNAISKVVDLIEAIAFQTNLLALNAGVEAARAGENGRGFAVVAMEVRALAQRSSDAVQEINGFIVESRADVEAGVKEVSAAGEAIEGVIAQITEASARMAQIVQTVTEQSVALCDIETAVGDIDQAMQHNAAAFEETASVGIELANEAQRLNDLMGAFKLEKVCQVGAQGDSKAA